MHVMCFDQTPHPSCPPLPLPSPCAQLSPLSPLSAACMGTGAGSPPRQSICTLSRITSLENTLIPPVSMFTNSSLTRSGVSGTRPCWNFSRLDLAQVLSCGHSCDLVCAAALSSQAITFTAGVHCLCFYSFSSASFHSDSEPCLQGLVYRGPI